VSEYKWFWDLQRAYHLGKRQSESNILCSYGRLINNRTKPRKMKALELIANERKRQIEQEGYTAEHDDKLASGELAKAAATYALAEYLRKYVGEDYLSNNPPTYWPWSRQAWKPTPDDRIRELVKAGALI